MGASSFTAINLDDLEDGQVTWNQPQDTLKAPQPHAPEALEKIQGDGISGGTSCSIPHLWKC